MTGMALMILGIMLLLLLAGFPMMVPLAAATLSVLVVFFSGDVTPAIIIQQWIGGITPSALIAVPMFILAADVMTRGQAAGRLLDAVAAFVGHVRGGLPMTTAVSCAVWSDEWFDAGDGGGHWRAAASPAARGGLLSVVLNCADHQRQ